MNKVGVTLSETFRRGSFMTWLLDIENGKKKKLRENEFENHSKVELNWEQCGFRKVLEKKPRWLYFQLNLEHIFCFICHVNYSEMCIHLGNGNSAR